MLYDYINAIRLNGGAHVDPRAFRMYAADAYHGRHHKMPLHAPTPSNVTHRLLVHQAVRQMAQQYERLVRLQPRAH